MKVSRDVTFDEKSLWDWSDRDKELYVFYPIDTNRKKVEEEPIKLVTPSSPVSPTQSSPSSSSVNSPIKTGPQGKRSLEEIYDDLNKNQGIEKWRKAMNEEIGAIVKNDTWELTTLQYGKKLIGVKWVYKVKKNSKGKVERYKVRLVVKRYKQRAGIDYDEVFAPVVRLETI
ncbi:hypothetical protein RJ639_004022 [Escallonia herrerae]|uniref:Reverse transcriptase Ty1/copia-type domain-containing protein n=1 Tax=Escallonia herrerae TaxID=1293975 RepID=A0AA88W240_9ASTE|nr:hypothetical protein RJ639_004022 [Escallonia herrerae]